MDGRKLKWTNTQMRERVSKTEEVIRIFHFYVEYPHQIGRAYWSEMSNKDERMVESQPKNEKKNKKNFRT